MDLETVLLAFIPLLVAFDAVGIVPMYLGLTSGISDREKKKLVLNATLTAFIIYVLFLFIGNAVIKFLVLL